MALLRCVLYSNTTCPYSHRARIALHAAGAQLKWDLVEINILDKPSWYKGVEAGTKVPVLSYGASASSDVSAPPTGTFILPESGLIADFVASLVPSIAYADPVTRAKAALMAVQFDSRVQKAWLAFTADGQQEPLLAAIRGFLPYIQPELLRGEYGVADAIIAPFLGRLFLAAQNEIGLWPVGTGAKLLEALKADEFASFTALHEKILSWSAYTGSFEEGATLQILKTKLEVLRKAKA